LAVGCSSRTASFEITAVNAAPAKTASAKVGEIKSEPGQNGSGPKETAKDAGKKESAKKTGEAKKAVPPERMRVFISALAMWCIVFVLGTGLVVAVMIWGRRLRRSVQQRAPASTIPDPFWYLKNKQLPVTTPAPSSGSDPGFNLGKNPPGRPNDPPAPPSGASS